MAPLDLFRMLRAQPFRPFRLHVDDGTAHDVADPADAFVTGIELILTIARDEAGMPTKAARFHPSHVVRVEPLPAASR